MRPEERDPHPLVRPFPLRPAGQHTPRHLQVTKETLARTETLCLGRKWSCGLWRRWLDLLSCVCLVLFECNVFCLTQAAFLSI